MLKKNVNDFNPFLNDLKTNWAIVTVGDRDNHNGLTVSWGGIGELWNKNVCYIFIRKSRYSAELINKFDNFTISFFNGEYKDVLGSVFGRVSGRDKDKFMASGLDSVYDVDNNCCYVKQAKRVLKCRKLYQVDLSKGEFFAQGIIPTCYPDSDYHVMYVGEIFQYLVNEDEK